MTLIVFIVSLLGAMAIGVPVAFALMFCGVVLMSYMGMFNTQIIAQNMIAGADTFFVASYVDDDAGHRQVDASHRGGKAGFVRIDADGALTTTNAVSVVTIAIIVIGRASIHRQIALIAATPRATHTACTRSTWQSRPAFS